MVRRLLDCETVSNAAVELSRHAGKRNLTKSNINRLQPINAAAPADVHPLDDAAQGSHPDLASDRLRQVLSELAALKQGLAENQLQSDALAELNLSLRLNLIRLLQKFTRARYLAYHDALTGLPNRALFVDRLRQAMAQAIRQRKQVAVLFIDVDEFKGVNDKYGHPAGDKLLQHVAERIVGSIRGGDTVCRYGGDEFMIMLPQTENKEPAAVVEKLVTRLASPYVIEGESIAVTASIGTAVYPADGQSYSELIRQADIAMYLAKAINKNRRLR